MNTGRTVFSQIMDLLPHWDFRKCVKRYHGDHKTQVWIAVSVYVLVAILKKRLDLDQSLYTILQVFSVSIFEKTLISELFSQTETIIESTGDGNQLLLFDL